MKCLLSLLCGGGASGRPPATHRPLTGLSHSGPDRPAAHRRVAGPLISAARMLAAIAILAAPVAASAGHYNYYYSGPAPYQHLGPAGAGTFFANVGGGGSQTVSGEVTVTFVWAPDGGADAPPASTFVTINSTTSSEAAGPNCLAIAICGLPGSTTTNSPFSPYYMWQDDAATYTFVQSEPGDSFTYKLSPSLEAVRSWGSCQATVSAGTTPVVMGFLGATGSAGTGYSLLVGQNVEACVSAGTATFSGMYWRVDDYSTVNLDPPYPAVPEYSSFVASLNSGHAYRYLAFDDGATYGPSYFADPETHYYRASGTATFNGKTYQVMATGTIAICEPDTTADSACAPFGGLAASAPGIEVIGYWPIPDGVLTGTPSIKWTVSVATPASFGHLGQGLWQLVQLVTPGRSMVRGDGSSWVLQNQGLTGLDTSLPYAPTSGQNDPNSGYPDDGTVRSERDGLTDSPVQPFQTDATSVTISDSYEMFLMYRPFDSGLGSEWVPLRHTPWTWNAIPRPTAGSWPTALTPCGTYSGTTVPWYTYPAWDRVIDSAVFVRQAL